MSWPQPTPQYGQIERAICASSVRACIARVFSDIASSPVPSLRSRICRTSGHFESNAVSDVMSFSSPLNRPFSLIVFLPAAVKHKTGRSRLVYLCSRVLSRSQPDVDLRCECAVDGTLCRDLHQCRVLFRTQRTGQFNFDVDSVHHSFPGFALLAVFCVNTRMPE